MEACVIGTRGSPLAMWQADHVRRALLEAHPGLEVRIEVIRTTGDVLLEPPLAKIGGTGVFTKEIENALLKRQRGPGGAQPQRPADSARRRPSAGGRPRARGPGRRPGRARRAKLGATSRRREGPHRLAAAPGATAAPAPRPEDRPGARQRANPAEEIRRVRRRRHAPRPRGTGPAESFRSDHGAARSGRVSAGLRPGRAGGRGPRGRRARGGDLPRARRPPHAPGHDGGARVPGRAGRRLPGADRRVRPVARTERKISL